MKFSELNFEPHPNPGFDTHATVFFNNGYGASVIQGNSAYTSGSNEFELAVLKGNKENWKLTYDTSITDDVIGNLSKQGVEETLNKIKDLKGEDNES